MSDQITPTSHAQNSAAEVTTDPVTTAGAATSNSGELNASTTINSMEDLKTRAPKVWNAMMTGVAQMIMNDMQNHSNNLIKLMKEYQRDA